MTSSVQRLAFVGLFVFGSAARSEPIQLSLFAGIGATTADRDGFTFDAEGRLVIDRVVTPRTVEAGTAGGWMFFGGTGLPVVLPVADGGAFVTSGDAPAALTRELDGLSSEVPYAGGSAPTTAPRLSVQFTDDRSLEVAVADAAGSSVGRAVVVVPAGGWWVINLGPAHVAESEPPPVGGVVEPVIVPAPPGVPEPATALLAAVGLAAVRVAGGRRRARRPAA